MVRDAARSDELVAAYVDGVSELSSAERKLVEDHLASAGRAEEAATREVLGQLRDLPRAGQEPDWGALERSISEAVGPAAPRSWWQRFGWRVVVPCAAFATAAAIVLLVARPDDEPREVATVLSPPPELTREPALADEATIQLWLDGANIEVELHAEELLDEPWGGDLNEEDLLPASDLAWIDELDAEALERAERWFENPVLTGRKRS